MPLSPTGTPLLIDLPGQPQTTAMPVPTPPIPTPPALILPPPGQQGVAVAAATAVSLDIHKLVADSLKNVPEGHTMAALSITTDRGVNLAIAHRDIVEQGILHGEWTTELWIGKSGWTSAVPEGGVQIMFSR